jgi:hypothetical protein
VTTKGQQLVVDLPFLDDDALGSLRSSIAQNAVLQFKLVDNNADLMRRLYAHVGATTSGDPTDPEALAAGIRAEIDQWRPEDGSPPQTDYYLVAHDRTESVDPEEARRFGCPRAETCMLAGRAVIERYVAALARKDPTFRVPADRQLAFERLEAAHSAQDVRPAWRSYYLERASGVGGAMIADATASPDPYTKQPVVIVTFTRAGAHAFGELTSRIAGKKLATLLDGTVRSAPIISGPIRGGRASIALGPHATEREVDELAHTLRAGTLPAPVVEASLTKSP